jgi:hypothetical protein
MMKKAILSLLIVGAAASSYGQGFVNFNTSLLGTSAQVFNSSGSLASGSAYLTRLFAADGAGVSSSSLNAVGTFPVNFRGGTAVGYNQISGTTAGAAGNNVIATPSVQVTSQASGQVTLQMRAWSSAFSSYAAAISGGGEYGQSAALTFTPYYAPATPGAITGLQGFTMVPEPSTVALGVLGAGSLLFAIRRRK